MKRLIIPIILSLGLLASCKDRGANEDYPISGKINSDRVYSFVSLDAFSPELDVISDNKGFMLTLKLKVNKIENYTFTEEWAEKNGLHLREQMKEYNLHYPALEGDTETLFVFAGLSGNVRIYAEEDYKGYKAGEDLSGLFECLARGRIKFPEMDIVADDHLLEAQRTHHEASFHWYNLKEYNSESIIPIMGVEGIYHGILAVRPLNQIRIDSPLTLHIEIPVLGLDKNQKEQSLLLTGVCTIAGGQ